MLHRLLAAVSQHADIRPGEELSLRPHAAVIAAEDAELLLDPALRIAEGLSVYLVNNLPPAGANISPERETELLEKGVRYIGPANGGIPQMLLAEAGLAFPGGLIAGTDAGLAELGVFGAFFISTDKEQTRQLLESGAFAYRVPEVTGIRLQGSPAEWVSGIDIALALLKYHSLPDKAGSCLEFYGDGLKALSLPERHNLLRILADFGYSRLLCEADEETIAFLQDRSEAEAQFFFAVESGAETRELMLDLSRVGLMLARQEEGAVIIGDLLDKDGMAVDQIFIGGDTACRYEDFEKGLKLLGYHALPERLSALIMPGTALVAGDLLDTGVAGILSEIGFQLFPSSFLSLAERYPDTGRQRLATSVKLLRQGALLANAAVCFAAAAGGNIIHPLELEQSLRENERHPHEETHE